jgi:hypothetical protein
VLLLYRMQDLFLQFLGQCQVSLMVVHGDFRVHMFLLYAFLQKLLEKQRRFFDEFHDASSFVKPNYVLKVVFLFYKQQDPYAL